MKTEGAPAAGNWRICRSLRSEPSLAGGGGGGGGGGGATGWPWMWRIRRYCPSPRLVSVQGRRGRSVGFAVGAWAGGAGGGRVP